MAGGNLGLETGQNILLEGGTTPLRLEPSLFLSITSTQVMQLPVNCVLDGQQREPVSKLMGLNGAITGPLRGVFGE